jgi:ABC-2 type transport system ATP-binding protein
MTMAYVEIDDLYVQYGRTVAVKGISFNIPKGEVFGFIGPNGAGKTTTIKVLATLLKPSVGSADTSATCPTRSASTRT